MPSKGYKQTPEHIAKRVAAIRSKGRRSFTVEHMDNISASLRGRHQSKETRAKISAAMKGRQFTDEHRAKLSAAERPSGEAHSGWQGDKVSYDALHKWVRKNKEKVGRCSKCGKEARTEWHNIDGEYRRDLNDFIEVCKSCHKALDAEIRGD